MSVIYKQGFKNTKLMVEKIGELSIYLYPFFFKDLMTTMNWSVSVTWF